MGIDALDSDSMVSVYAAGGSGLIVLACVWVSLKKPRVGYIAAMVIALVILLRFAPLAFGAEGKMYPDMVATVASALAIAALIGGHLLSNRSKGSKETATD